MTGNDYKSLLDGFDKDAETESFRGRFRRQLSTADSEILGYPNTSHEVLVKSATSRRKPFDQDGSGYRDALIWQSVLELAKRVEGPVVLVSNDGDFANRNKLYADLIEDLDRLGLPKDKVVLATGIAKLVDDHVRPHLGIAPWENPLQLLAERGINLEDAFGLLIQDACDGIDWDPIDLGVPPECETVSLDMVHDVSNLELVDVRKLDTDQVMIKAVAQISGEFQDFMYVYDYYAVDDSRLYLVDSNWSDHYVVAGINLSLRCELNFIVDDSASEDDKIRVVSVALQALDG